MAFSNLEKAMAAVIGLDIARPGFSRAAAKQAVRVIGTATLGAGRVAAPLAPTVSQIGAAPVGLGVATGLGILGTPEGQELIAAAEQKGRDDRVRFEQFITDVTEPVKRKARKTSKYSKAVKAGMAAVKKSKFGGKKGVISNAKSTFATVNKVASAVNKGKKVANKGIRGTIAKAVRKIL
tara:strand:- start:14 stop:553 length:540 start_codon:yes stop_codon:yes gene_type:complete